MHEPDGFRADVCRADVKASCISEARDTAAGVFRAVLSRADDNNAFRAGGRLDDANCGGGVAGKRAEPAVDMYHRDVPRGDDHSSVSRKSHYKPDIFRGDDVTEVSRCVCVYQQGMSTREVAQDGWMQAAVACRHASRVTCRSIDPLRIYRASLSWSRATRRGAWPAQGRGGAWGRGPVDGRALTGRRRRRCD